MRCLKRRWHPTPKSCSSSKTDDSGDEDWAGLTHTCWRQHCCRTAGYGRSTPDWQRRQRISAWFSDLVVCLSESCVPCLDCESLIAKNRILRSHLAGKLPLQIFLSCPID